MSWIHLDDWLAALLHVAMTPTMAGPVNLVAPEPTTNAAFSRTLGAVLGRPAALPVPGFAVRALLGDMGDALLLHGTRVLPGALTRSGFAWRLGVLEDALRMELGRMPAP